MRGGTVATRVASGNPLADAAILLDGSTFAFAPAGTGADVTLSLTGKDGLLDGTLTYSGGATLALDKGANQSLTVRLSPPAGFAPLARTGTGTLTIAPVGGLATLGSTQKIFLDVASPEAVFALAGGFVGQDGDVNRSGDLLTYDATAGLTRAVFSTSTNLNTGSFGAPFHATTPQTLTRPVNVSGLKNSGHFSRRFLHRSQRRVRELHCQRHLSLFYRRFTRHHHVQRSHLHRLHPRAGRSLHRSASRRFRCGQREWNQRPIPHRARARGTRASARRDRHFARGTAAFSGSGRGLIRDRLLRPIACCFCVHRFRERLRSRFDYRQKFFAADISAEFVDVLHGAISFQSSTRTLVETPRKVAATH